MLHLNIIISGASGGAIFARNVEIGAGSNFENNCVISTGVGGAIFCKWWYINYN